MPTDFVAEPGVASPAERARLETQVLLLQCATALFYCAGVYFGLFGAGGPARLIAVLWIGPYHLFHAWYVLRYRVGGRRIRWVEALTPPADISCVTVGWIALGNASSPFWGVYPYALVGYARRIHGRLYWLLASFVVANLVFARMALSLDGGASVVDSNLAIMVFITLAIASLSSLIGSAWRRAERQARLLAETDPLTGIANRRTFLQDLELLAETPDAAFSLLMLDLDDFKRLNDEHGHLHGDEVLARVAAILSANIRGSDRLARYGGEEFVVAMPGTGLIEARAMAERLRAAIGATTPTSVSIGCATRLWGEPAESVLRRADDLLLAAKRQGKNAVRASEPFRKSA